MMEGLSAEEELAQLLKTLFAEKKRAESLERDLERVNKAHMELKTKLASAIEMIESLKCQSDEKMFDEHVQEVASELKVKEAALKKAREMHAIERARQEEERQKLSLRLSDAFGQIQRLTEQVRRQKEEKKGVSIEEKSQKILEKIKFLLADAEG